MKTGSANTTNKDGCLVKTLLTDGASIVAIVTGFSFTACGISLLAIGAGTPDLAVVWLIGRVLDQFPGIPFSITDISNQGIGIMGVVSWVVGVDALLLGLGLWRHHRLANYVGLLVFSVAAIFDFIRFLFLGVVGAPDSLVGAAVNGLIALSIFGKVPKI